MCRMSLALVFPDRDGLQVARALGPLAPLALFRQICRAHELTMTRGIAAAVKIERRCQSFRLMLFVVFLFRERLLFCGLLNDHSAKQLRHDHAFGNLIGYKRWNSERPHTTKRGPCMVMLPCGKGDCARPSLVAAAPLPSSDPILLAASLLPYTYLPPISPPIHTGLTVGSTPVLT